MFGMVSLFSVEDDEGAATPAAIPAATPFA
jgi:hypothetical protein